MSSKIERDRYKKPYVERSQRICEKCSSNQTEDELHFIINCPLSHPNLLKIKTYTVIFGMQISHL
jgi:hypothetical protein